MEIDWSIVVFEVLNFGVLVWLLKRFLFRPVAKALQERREAIEAQRHEVEAREAAAEQVRREFEDRVRGLDQRARTTIEQAMEEGRQRRADAIDEGRSKAREMLDEAREEIATGRRQALHELRREVLGLASAAATRVVRDMSERSVTRAFTRRAAHALQDAARDLGEAAIEVWVPPDEDTDAIVAELHDELGPVVLRVNTDPELVAGVRLVAGGREVESSASASLAAWYAEQLGEQEDDIVEVAAASAAG